MGCLLALFLSFPAFVFCVLHALKDVMTSQVLFLLLAWPIEFLGALLNAFPFLRSETWKHAPCSLLSLPIETGGIMYLQLGSLCHARMFLIT